MTESEAREYLDRTNWLALRMYLTGEPIPKEIEEKREKAYGILELERKR